jgi:hypothetical protein
MSQNNTKVNGSAPRKQLSEQLDRLDNIIDALDEGLKGAVADAVREAVAVAVQEAVQAVVRELLSNPEVLRAVAGAAQPQQSTTSQLPTQQALPGQGLLSGVRNSVRRAWSTAVAALTFVAAWALSAGPSVIDWVSRANQFVWRHRVVAGASLAVGLAVGAASSACPQAVSSVALAVCGTAMSAVTFVILPLTTVWARLTARRTA